jgi:hypothetical protein
VVFVAGEEVRWGDLRSPTGLNISSETSLRPSCLGVAVLRLRGNFHVREVPVPFRMTALGEAAGGIPHTVC